MRRLAAACSDERNLELINVLPQTPAVALLQLFISFSLF